MSTIARLSLEEYERIVEAGVFSRREQRHIEFIHGEIREMTPIGDPHAEVVDRLAEWGHDATRGKNVRVRVQNAIRLPAVQSAPEPDISWVVKRDYWRGKPEAEDILLIIEVAETSVGHDTREKAGCYSAAGIRDYWVVNLPDRRIEVYRDPSTDRYRSLEIHSGGDEVRPLLFPEIALRPETLWQ
jgi:Uma2 family endonuclease